MAESMTDRDLLRDFSERGSESAFQSLVARHIDLVFGTAMRGLSDDSAAREVSQNVFLALARKAGSLRRENSLAGWLHQTTLLETRQWWRGELRRQRREQTAVELSTTMKDDDSLLKSLAGVLDEGLLELRDADREALLLRFFEEKSHREIGNVLGTNEDAARKRIDKALESLTGFFRRRGYAVPAAAVTVSVLQGAAQAAPAGLAASVSATAILSSAAIHSTTALAAAKTIATTTMQKTLITTVIAGLGFATSLLIEHQSEASLRGEAQSLRAQAGQIVELQTENQRLADILTHTKSPESRSNHELVQLRSETGFLRRQTNDLIKLAEENRRLSMRADAQAQSITNGLLPKESWAFVGFATPEDAFQSSAWAVGHHEVKKFLDCLTPKFREKFKDTKSIEGLNGITSFDTKEFGVINKEVRSDDEVILKIQYGDHYGNFRIVSTQMKKIEGNWKVGNWQ